jgi:amidase
MAKTAAERQRLERERNKRAKDALIGLSDFAQNGAHWEEPRLLEPHEIRGTVLLVTKCAFHGDNIINEWRLTLAPFQRARTAVMPVSQTQDAVGPIARNVADAARMLEVMAGYDPNDPSTAWSVGYTPATYTPFLEGDGMRGARIGLLKTLQGGGPEHQEVNAVVAEAVTAMKKAGAIVVEVDDPMLGAAKLNAENDVQKYEFKSLINAYLASIPNAPAKSLEEIIASGKFHKASLENFLKSAQSYQNGMQEPDYPVRLMRNARTRDRLISLMAEHQLDAVIYPLQQRLVVPLSELNQADRNGILASVTGFPAITVPAGFSRPTATAPLGVPIGLDILGRPWSEGRLIQIAQGFEHATHSRRLPVSTPLLNTK